MDEDVYFVDARMRITAAWFGPGRWFADGWDLPPRAPR